MREANLPEFLDEQQGELLIVKKVTKIILMLLITRLIYLPTENLEKYQIKETKIKNYIVPGTTINTSIMQILLIFFLCMYSQIYSQLYCACNFAFYFSHQLLLTFI